MSNKISRLEPDELETVKAQFKLGHIPVGVDLAARTFQVCYVDPNTLKLKNRDLTREEFLDFIEHPIFSEPMTIGFEACGACQFWARKIAACGHRHKIMPVVKIKAFCGQDKTDRLDAMSIFKAVLIPSVKAIGARTEENQLLNMIFTVRNQLIKQQVQCCNCLRGLLYEVGTVCKQTSGFNGLSEAVQQQSSVFEPDSKAAEYFKTCSDSLISSYQSVTARLTELDTAIRRYAQEDPQCRNFMTIPGIGALTAAALTAVMGNPDDFANSRHFAAFVGFVPRVTGTGGKVSTGWIRRTGNHTLRKMLYMCAVAKLAANTRKDPERHSKISRLIDERSLPKKKVICALANRLARVAWSVAKSGEAFNPAKCRLLG